VASAAAGIGEGLPRFGNELPLVRAGLESELEDTEGSGIAYFTVGLHLAERAMILATRTDDEFTDAALGIGGALWRLGGEALVVVVVAANNDFSVGVVEGLPERLHRQIIAVRTAGTEKRLVPVSESTGGGMRGKIGAQPFFLGGTGFAAADVLAFAIQDDDVPRSEFVAVVAGLRVASGRAKIIEIRRGTGSVELVIAGAGRVRDFTRPQVLS